MNDAQAKATAERLLSEATAKAKAIKEEALKIRAEAESYHKVALELVNSAQKRVNEVFAEARQQITKGFEIAIAHTAVLKDRHSDLVNALNQVPQVIQQPPQPQPAAPAAPAPKPTKKPVPAEKVAE